jgi:hypothetical protein
VQVDRWDDPEPEPAAPTGPPVQARLAIALSCGAVLGLAAMSSTVDGTSNLALSAVGGDSNAIILATMGYAAGIILTMAGLLVSIQPIERDHGRRIALIAAAIALTSPATASVISLAMKAFP